MALKSGPILFLVLAIPLALLSDRNHRRVVQLEAEVEALQWQIDALGKIEMTVGSPAFPDCRVTMDLRSLVQLGSSNIERWGRACAQQKETQSEDRSTPRRPA